MEILTNKALYDMDSENLDELWTAQNSMLEKLGYEMDETYVIRFGQQKKSYLTTIYDAIECLALKDGCDLVKFSDGKIGFVGYYNGFSLAENCFRILRLPTEHDIYEDENYGAITA